MTQTTNDGRVEQILKTHKVLVDTCFLLHPNFDRFLAEHADLFQVNRLLVPKKVVQELERIEKLNDHRLKAAETALSSVRTGLSKGLAEVRREASDEHSNADNVISRVVEQHVTHHSIAVLTNDRMLRDWIYAKKRAGCFHSSTASS